MDDRYPTNGANALQEQPWQPFTKPIGGTYEVFVSFSTKSKENINDKILRLIIDNANTKVTV